MFANYKIRIENGEEVLYLYLDEHNTEFANELKNSNKDKKERTLKDFISRNKINFKGSLVKMVLGGVLLGSMMLGNTNVSAQTNTYKVQSGDNLWNIAREYGTTVDELKSINNLTSDTLQIGQELVITQSNETTYTVKYGDNLWNIAKDNNITVESLRNANNLTTDVLQVGQELTIPNAQTTQTNQQSTYTVKYGDNLWNIAKDYNTTVDSLRNANNLTTDVLQVGQELTIPNAQTTQTNQQSTYTVRYGDNLWNIARDFNTTVDNLRTINNLTTDTLQIGQELIINPGTTEVSNTTYTVQAGDNLWLLARQFNTTEDTIRQTNNLTTDTLQIGQELVINPGTTNNVINEQTSYTVQPGDNLWVIARQFNTTEDNIRQTNNLTTDTLQIGQELFINENTNLETNQISYSVQSGDNLWVIARQFNTTEDNIRQTNNLTTDALQIGQQLIINQNTKIDNTVTIEDASNVYISVQRLTGEVEQIALEEYIVGVVASEMDPSFHTEALKAQALAARTYAVELYTRNETLQTTDRHQVYNDESQLRALWGHEYETFIQRVRNAVYSTQGEVITYNGDYIEAYYFSTSNGKTEDPAYVWGGEVPYLASVDSSYDVNAREYAETKTMPKDTFINALGINTSNFDIEILSYTSGGRIDQIRIGGVTYSGLEVKSRLGLRSTDFTIEVKDTTVNITTRGYGHGVGMSQFGAHFMGVEGYSYENIIHHYYQNVTIEKIG